MQFRALPDASPNITPTTGVAVILSVAVAVMLSVAIGFCTVSVLAALPFLTTDLVLALLTAVVAAFPVVRRIARGTLDIFEPVFGACLMLFLLFGLRPAVVLLDRDYVQTGYDIEPYITEALVAGCLGTFAFVAFYELASGKYIPLTGRRLETSFSLPSLYVFGAVMGFFAFSLYLLHLSIGGSVTQSFSLLLQGRSDSVADLQSASSEYLSGAPVLTISFAILLVLSSRPTDSRLRLLVTLVAIAFPVATFSLIGGRRFILPSMAIPLAVHYLSRQTRPPWLLLGAAVPIAFLLIATVPYARYAGARQNAGGVWPIFQAALERPFDTTWHTLAKGEDTAMFKSLAIEIAVLDGKADHSYGKATVGDVALAPIPTLIFPDKPQTARNELLIAAFDRPCEVGTGGSCPDFSAIGTFYQDFWYVGILIGMGALGAGSGVLWRSHKQSPTPFLTIAVACWTVFLPVILRAGFMPSFAWFLYFFLPALAGLWWVTKRTPQRFGKASLAMPYPEVSHAEQT